MRGVSTSRKPLSEKKLLTPEITLLLAMNVSLTPGLRSRSRCLCL